MKNGRQLPNPTVQEMPQHAVIAGQPAPISRTPATPSPRVSFAADGITVRNASVERPQIFVRGEHRTKLEVKKLVIAHGAIVIEEFDIIVPLDGSIIRLEGP